MQLYFEQNTFHPNYILLFRRQQTHEQQSFQGQLNAILFRYLNDSLLHQD